METRRRWWQFGLRDLLWLSVVVALATGWRVREGAFEQERVDVFLYKLFVKDATDAQVKKVAPLFPEIGPEDLCIVSANQREWYVDPKGQIHFVVVVNARGYPSYFVVPERDSK